MNYYAQMASPLGDMLLQATTTGLAGLYFVDQKDAPIMAGVQPPKARFTDPRAGLKDGAPISRFKVLLQAAHKAPIQAESPDLFTDSRPEVSSSSVSRPVASGLGSSFQGEDDAVSVTEEPPVLQPRLDQRRSGAQCGPLVWQQTEIPPDVQGRIEEARNQLDEYFSGRRQNFDLELDLAARGTPFQRTIWQALLKVPYGKVLTYGELGRQAGLPAGHGRAIGSAVGRNPLTIIVPCHRIVASGALLNGYSGGLHRKLALLQLEGVACAAG